MAAISTTVVTILDLGGYNPYRASVIGVDSTATTYTLACPPTGNGCGYGAKSPDITVVAGPSTAAQTVIVDSLTQFSTLACHVSASTQIVGRCSRVGVDRTSFTFEDRFQSITLVAVTVTAGAEKLSQDAGQTTATSADAPHNNPTHTSTPTGSPSSTSTSSPSSTSTSSPSPTGSSGAAGKVAPAVLGICFVFLCGLLV